MNLDELKKNMSLLDDVLEQKTSDTLTFDRPKCNAAQARISAHYRRTAAICGILSVVFFAAGMGGVNEVILPNSLKFYLSAILVAAGIWYAFLYHKVGKINVATDTPMCTMRKVAWLRFGTLAGEFILSINFAIFFTLLFSNLWELSHYKVWLIAGALVVAVIYDSTKLLKLIRDFRDLTAAD